MNWTKVAEFPAEAQLQSLHQYLEARKVIHRFTEAGNRQELWLTDIDQLPIVTEYLQALERGAPPPNAPPVVKPAKERIVLQGKLSLFPLTIACLVLGVLGYIIAVPLANNGIFRVFLFEPLELVMRNGEIWRLLSPVFLHWGVMHILFNGLWIWELGRRIEVFSGRLNFLILFLVSGIAGNYLEFLVSATNGFGGLSGVVYGFVGYLWLWSRNSDSPVIRVPPGIYGAMLVFLLLGFSGVFDLIVGGQIANWAHLGGLIGGVAVAAGEIYIKPSKPGTRKP